MGKTPYFYQKMSSFLKRRVLCLGYRHLIKREAYDSLSIFQSIPIPDTLLKKTSAANIWLRTQRVRFVNIFVKTKALTR